MNREDEERRHQINCVPHRRGDEPRGLARLNPCSCGETLADHISPKGLLGFCLFVKDKLQLSLSDLGQIHIIDSLVVSGAETDSSPDAYIMLPDGL